MRFHLVINPRVLLSTTLLAAGFPLGLFGQPLDALPSSPTVQRAPDSTARGKHRGGGLLIVGGALAAAVGNQVLGSPKGWPRTATGFASRVGDQLAFAIVEESLRAAVDAAVDWVPDTLPCGRSVTTPTRVGVVRRVGCAVRQTAIMRTTTGRARPNLPFATGVVLASLASASWRPERQSAVSARALVATRIAVVFGASAGTKLVTTWWRDRARSRDVEAPLRSGPPPSVPDVPQLPETLP